MNKKKLKKYFSKNLKHGWRWERQSQAIFNFLIEAAAACKGGVMLDAGAGRQRYKPFFEDAIYISQEHHSGINFKNMHDIKYDLISPIDEKILLKDNCLDAVLSTSVVEHLGRSDRFFCEAYRVLKPEGKLFVNVPFVHHEHEIPFDFNRPTRFGLEKWFKDAGFEDIVIKPSSSSTEAVCVFLPFAIENDILKSNKCCSGILKDTLKTKDGYIKVLLKLPLLAFAKIMRNITQCFCFLARLLIDRGPHDGTTFPVGWVASARKTGSLINVEVFRDKNDFLNKCAL